MSTVISVEHLSKSYKLGQINTGTFTYDLQMWWARVRGKPSPWQTIGEPDENRRNGEIVWALKDVSFQVEQGEVLGIIGRNGAGKSTLLKILSRVTAPTAGVVKIKGRIASLLEVGTGFHPDLTGRENVYLNGAIMGMDRREVTRKFDEIVDFSGVEKFIDTPVKRYSSGMYVRLAFAVAAHLDPEILVVDEVLAVGDAEFQKKCLGKMGDVAQEGRTVLFVSHNMASIRQLCAAGMLLDSGYMHFLGDIDSCVAAYTNHGQSSDRIVDNGKSLFESLQILAVTVNGSECSEINLFPSVRNLNIVLRGCTSSPTKIGLEVKFLDSNDGVIAFYCPAHFDSRYNQSQFIVSGNFELTANIELPLLTKGNYFLDLFLTDPAVRGLWECKKGLHIVSESLGMITNYTVLEYKSGHGAILLQGDYEIFR